MVMRCVRWLLLLPCFTVQPASASDWIGAVNIDSGGQYLGQYLIDTSSFRKVGNYTSVWVKAQSRVGVRSWMALQYHNCAEGSYANRQLNVYNPDGSLKTVRKTETPWMTWLFAEPDTAEATMHAIICDLSRRD